MCGHVDLKPIRAGFVLLVEVLPKLFTCSFVRLQIKTLSSVLLKKLSLDVSPFLLDLIKIKCVLYPYVCIIQQSTDHLYNIVI
jgi:hypothetical protein